MSLPHTTLMSQALTLATQAQQETEIPVGALLVNEHGTILATAHNLTETRNDPLAHAELLVLQHAIASTGQRHFPGCTLVVTLEPCAMCMGAICAARVGSVVFGAYDVKSGGTVHGARVPQHSHHQPHVLGGILEDQCQAQLKAFFTTLRA